MSARLAEHNENEFETSANSRHFPPPRTPLNTIADPAQYQNECQDSGLESNYKLQSIKVDWPSDKNIEISRKSGNAYTNLGTPRFSAHGRKVSSEPNSTQSTPAKSYSRASFGGASTATGSKAHHHAGGRGGSSFSIPRRLSAPNTELPVGVLHFDLVEDPSFWKDHNVQVLIRIRPLSTTERFSQGYGRCLRQESAKTLEWLGHPETRFTFDHIVCETISQENLFEVAGRPMVENCMSGYNSCMFAYGQTGSGKTYTMMGGVYEVEGKLNEDCGLTLRIFEHLFARIRLEEKSKTDVKMKYSCKCSFLEIYNEQIADLLEPSSTNLQLREDSKKGIYVENLTEHNVMTVNDVVKLLLKGAANRKMAATHMNSESSRSHSVLTCTIESHWEKDSMTHFRFARLNLVDLAGSERQKSSGAEGDRLKEAVNINKSLSTLGLVIMSLVDLAHGKHRHVPYRDSRLTFLLQDSLGGNSKTIIIANVSPSLCSANETLSTLKFAQRAKQIQNNAKINEDTLGDETALQRQILHLKGRLSFLLKHSNLSRSLLSYVPTFEESRADDLFEGCDQLEERKQTAIYKMKLLEDTLLGALRREKVADTAMQKLGFEIKHMKLLVFQQEEDAQRTKMLLKFREEKIRKLELLLGGMLSADNYLLEENKALVVENKMLQVKINRNPELTKVSFENSKLIEQLQVFQNFYELGEREALLTEVAELRNELLVALEKDSTISERDEYQDFHITKGLVNLENSDTRSIGGNELQIDTRNYFKCSQDYATGSYSKHSKHFGSTDNVSLDETMSIKSYYRDDLPSHISGDYENLENEANQDLENELKVKSICSENDLTDARLLIKTKDHDNNMQDENHQCQEVKHNGVDICFQSLNAAKCKNKGNVMNQNEDVDEKALQAKLEKMAKELEEVRLSNVQYKQNQIYQLSQKNQTEYVHQQDEMDTASRILQLQEQVEAFQLQLNNRLYDLAGENRHLKDVLSVKDEEMSLLCIDWETAMIELTNFLLDSSRSIRDAHGHIECIANLFPKVNVGISEQVQRAIQVCVEKEETILLLHKSLEDAQLMVREMELKLDSLKGATMALNELQKMDDDEKNVYAQQSSDLMTDTNKTKIVEFADKRLRVKDLQLIEPQSHITDDVASSKNAILLEELDEVDLIQSSTMELKNIAIAHHEDMAMHVSALYNYIHGQYSEYKKLVQDLVSEVHDLRSIAKATNEKYKSDLFFKEDFPSTRMYLNVENENVLDQIKGKLFEAKNRLHLLEYSIDRSAASCRCQLINQYSVKEDGWSSDSSTSSSGFSSESVTHGGKHSGFLNSQFNCLERDSVNCEAGKTVKSEGPLDYVYSNRGTMTCLRKELCMTYDSFQNLYMQMDALITQNIGGFSMSEEMDNAKIPPNLTIGTSESSCNNTSKVASVKEIKNDEGLLTRFEEVQSTMKEADTMLNALLRANENAKQLTGIFKQACEQLQLERAILIEEVGQFKSSMNLKEVENKLLQEQFLFSLREVAESVSSLEGCISLMQREVDEKFGTISCDVVSTRYELHKLTNDWKSMMEDICSDILGREFASFVIYQCYMEDINRQLLLFKEAPGLQLLKHRCIESKNLHGSSFLTDKNDMMLISKIDSRGRGELVTSLEEEQGDFSYDVMHENAALKEELKRKEFLLEGLLFDFRLLQESTSKTKDMKDKTKKLDSSLSHLRLELENKASQLENVLVQQKKLECHLTDAEQALFLSNSKLDEAKETITMISESNSELKMQLEDLYLKKSKAEKQLAEQQDIVNKLENEIVHLTSVEKSSLSSVEVIENDLRKVISERDQLREQVCFLTDKLCVAYALADEKEAVAIEACQESEASKLYAELKEDEVKILERSVEELENTINMLEEKVQEMDEEVVKNQTLRESLESEIQIFRKRLFAVENLREVDSKDEIVDHTREQSRIQDIKTLEHLEAQTRIKFLEEEMAEQEREIKQYKEYISELVLHADAQATKYQQKYTSLEAMVRDASNDPSNPMTAPAIDKIEKSSARPRGSSSPFRCISNLVHQMNLEKEHELSVARLRIEELERLVTSRQKEICILNTRLAAAESMTHDVIRDLLGVKLDLTKYANLIDQCEVQKMVVEAHRQTQQTREKEQEVRDLKTKISDLNEERECYKSVLNKRDADVLATQIAYETLLEQNHLLSAQNEMLRMDSKNLKRRIEGLDEKVNTLHPTRSTTREVRHAFKPKDDELTKRLARSKMLLSRVNDEIVRYSMPGGSSYHQSGGSGV